MSIGHQANVVKEVLTKELITPQELADKLGVSIASINSWTSGRRNISTKHLRNLKKHFPDSFREQITTTEGETNLETLNDKNLIIRLQKEKIERLESEINEHECVYGGIQSDIIFDFQIKFNWDIKNLGFKVLFNDEGGNYIRLMSNKLGYSELEMANLLQIGELVDYKNHKIHKLRSSEDKKEMLNVMKNFMKAYHAVKVNTTLLIAELPVVYKHKNGTRLIANVEYRVNWYKGTGTAHIRWADE